MPKRATIDRGEVWITVSGADNVWRVDRSSGVWMRRKGANGERLLRRAHPMEVGLAAYVWAEYETLIRDASQSTGVDRRTIVACICTESSGSYKAERYEVHLHDYSIGVMQTLTRTARHVGGRLGYPTQTPAGDELATSYRMPKNSVPNGGTIDEWRRFLCEPRNSILVGAATLAELDKRYDLEGDPVLLAASYNAGGPYVDRANPWGLRMHGPHVDAFAGFWTLAAEALA